MLGPLPCLLIGVGLILFLILYLRFHAFLALVTAALAVAVLSDRIPLEEAVPLVTNRFGEMMAGIGLLLALSAVIGKCLMDSGAADRIVRAFSRVFGEGRENYSLLSSGFVLSIPVFFDTVFYLLAPLARAVYARRKRDYVLIICATAAGGAITHALVPPTPGPIIVSEMLKVSIGLMMMIGILCAIVPVIAGGVWYANWINRRMEVKPGEVMGISQEELEKHASKPDHELPSLTASLTPFFLPILLLAGASIIIYFTGDGTLNESEIKDLPGFLTELQQPDDPVSLYLNDALSPTTKQMLDSYEAGTQPGELFLNNLFDDLNRLISSQSIYSDERFAGIEIDPQTEVLIGQYKIKEGYLHLNRRLLEMAYPNYINQSSLTVIRWVKILGDKSLVFFFGAIVGLWLLIHQSSHSFTEAFKKLASAIESGAVVAFITCSGAAFGKALAEAGIGEMIANTAQNWNMSMLILAYIIAALIRVAQGSATVAMITAAGIIASSINALNVPLPYNAAYLVAMIGFGATGFTWMNDSGFWIFGQMTGLNEAQTLKTWTVLLTVMSLVGFFWVYLLTILLPLS